MAGTVVQSKKEVDNLKEDLKDDDCSSTVSVSSGFPSSVLRQSAFPSSGILAPSRLGSNPFISIKPSSPDGQFVSNPFAVKTFNNADSSESQTQPKISAPKFSLKPSVLDKQTVGFSTHFQPKDASGKCSFRLEPASYKNPFNSPKLSDNDVDSSCETSQEQTLEINKDKSSPPNSPSSSDDVNKNELVTPDETSTIKSTSPEDSSSSESKPNSFVFGEKLEDRVANGTQVSNTNVSSTSSNDASSFVFGSNLASRVLEVPPSVNGNHTSPTSDSDSKSPAKTLAESAAAHEAKKSKLNLDEVEVVTGEESESNVLQIHAKLFLFDKENTNWLERGRGTLRLNDKLTHDSCGFQSRMVMRTSGILKVILNTKIWPRMIIERASKKSVRISAFDVDDGIIKIFLIMTNQKDAEMLYSALDSRISQLKMKSDWDEDTSLDSVTSTQNIAIPECDFPHDKRTSDDGVDSNPIPTKRLRIDSEKKQDCLKEESDSSVLDPETEVSNESCSSTVKSSSSE